LLRLFKHKKCLGLNSVFGTNLSFKLTVFLKYTKLKTALVFGKYLFIKSIIGLLKREDYNKVEVENLINKIESNQEIEDNQIKPIVNNIKMKKDKGTYTEQFGMRAFRYVVDSQITSTVSEEFRNEVASSLLAKYE